MSMPRALSKNTSPTTRYAPFAGRSRPAIALTIVDLARARAPEQRGHPARRSVERGSRGRKRAAPPATAIVEHRAPEPAARGAPAARPSAAPASRQREGDAAPGARRCIAVGRLRRAVDRQRQRPRLARNVRREGDRRAELAEARGEGDDCSRPGCRAASAAGDGEERRRSARRRACAPRPRARGSTASSDRRIARTISGNDITAAASAAPAA